MDLWILLADIVILLAGALLLGSAFSHFGHSPLVGYLIAGMILGGPGSFGLVGSELEIAAIAELGVALLLFSLGLEFSLARLIKLGAKPLLGGVAQIAITIVAGALGASLFGLAVRESLAFGAMMALSSTAVVLRILMERSELDMPHGRNSLAVLLTQDMAVVPLALFMAILGGDGGADEIALDVFKILGVAVGLVVAMYVLNRIAVLALGTLTQDRNRELTVLFAIVSGLGAALAAHAAGISPALGAFVAGMLLGNSAFATQIRSDVASFRIVFLTLFFGSAGMVADPWWILKHWHLVGLVTLLLTVGKGAIIWIIFRCLGHTMRVAAATGISLAQVGEFAFVLGSIGLTAGVVSIELYALVVSVTIVSFFLSAFLVPRAATLAESLATKLGHKPDLPSGEPRALPPEVIVIGFGPAAQIASRPLQQACKRVTVLDLNHEGIRRARACGFHGEIGDATLPEVLDHVRASHAKAILVTVPHHKTAMSILNQVRQIAPKAHIVIRSRYQIHTAALQAGSDHIVIGDEEQVGKALADNLSDWLDSHESEDSSHSKSRRF